MPDAELRLLVETPHAIVLDAPTHSIRLPTESGQVGIRARHEAMVLAVEPGLVLVRLNGGERFIGTVGGLLYSDGATARLLTPWGVEGHAAAEVWSALERALSAPDAEMEARHKLGRLEAGILEQLRRDGKTTAPLRRA